MNLKNFLSEQPAIQNRYKMVNKKVKIIGKAGPYNGKTGTIVFSKLLDGDLRYYVVELDVAVKGVDVVIVYNGEYDFV